MGAEKAHKGHVTAVAAGDGPLAEGLLLSGGQVSSGGSFAAFGFTAAMQWRNAPPCGAALRMAA